MVKLKTKNVSTLFNLYGSARNAVMKEGKLTKDLFKLAQKAIRNLGEELSDFQELAKAETKIFEEFKKENKDKTKEIEEKEEALNKSLKEAGEIEMDVEVTKEQVEALDTIFRSFIEITENKVADTQSFLLLEDVEELLEKLKE